jgi:tetratricopeptide (TPR) repeat protein
MKTTHRILTVTTAALLLALLPTGCNKAAKTESHLAAARKYYEKADYAAAEIEFKNVLAATPNLPEALKGLGLILLRQGALPEAAHRLASAKPQLPTDDEVGVGLAQALFELGFLEDSRRELRAVLDRTPAHGEALMLLSETSLAPAAMTECDARIAAAKAPDQAPVLLASALLELRREQPDAAGKLIDRAIQAAPRCARAHVLQGILLATRKQPEQALEALKTAADLAGPRSAEAIAHAKLLLGFERAAEAAAALKQATAAAPDYLPAWRLLAQLSLTAENEAEAADHLARVLAKSPMDPEACLLQAELWLRQREPAKAVELLEKLTKTFPSRARLELALGKACLAAADFRKATDALDRTLALDPKSAEALLLRAGLDLQDGQAAAAIRALEPLVAADPGNRLARDLLVRAYLVANLREDALALLQQQTAAAPDDPALHLQLGQLLVGQGRLAEARTAFEHAVQLTPDELACIAQLIALDEQEGKHREAMARADAYFTNHPKSAQAHLLKAGLCFGRKDFKTAEALALKTIELNSQNLTAYDLLVRILIADGRSEQAIGHLRELLKTSPDNLPARMQLSTLLLELGRADEARAGFREMVSRAPDFAPAHNNLAWLEADASGDYATAVEHARKARALAPQSPAIADTLGWLEWLRGNFSEAMPLLLEAATGLPQFATVQYHLALGHYMMNQPAEATALLEKALAMPGDFPEKSAAERRLANLREGATLDPAALEARVKQDPKDVVLILCHAKALAAAGRPADAITAYRNALAINPQLEAAHLGLAGIFTGLNQPDQALAAATQARQVAPQSPRAAAVLGALNFRLNKHEDAFNLLQEAARKLPADTGVLIDLAWAAYAMGRVEEARAAMGKATPGDLDQAAVVRDFLALTAPDAAANPGTPALVETRLAASPSFVPALMIQAALAEQAGENPAAAYLNVLDLYPEFDPARVALARVYLADPKQLAAAEKLAIAARERLQDDPDLSGIMALINYRKGQFDYAAQLLNELSAKRPLTGGELFALGMSQAATHRSGEALKTLALALKSRLPEADAAAAKAALERLTNPDAKP